MSELNARAENLKAGCIAMGWTNGAQLVEELMQQRAELLEALKRSKYMNTTPEDWRFIQEAITKAEAAE